MAVELEELEEIVPVVRRPTGFERFWLAERARVADLPIAWERKPNPALSTDALQVETVRFQSVGGKWIEGWLASGSIDTLEPCAAMLYLPGYSYGNPLPGRDNLCDNVLTLCLNVHGNPPDTPYMHPRVVGGEYVTQGIESPETYIFRDIVAHCLRALDILAALDGVDGERVTVGGMSQGGGLALMCAALSAVPKLCFADMPWLCDLDRALSLIDPDRYKEGMAAPDGRAYIRTYAEAHPESADQIYETYRYFDPLSHAGDITIPVQVSAGGRDPSCRPPTIFSVYNAIRSEKEMLYLPTTGHEIVPAMREAHVRWLNGRLL